jgi:hypothetical protein
MQYSQVLTFVEQAEIHVKFKGFEERLDGQDAVLRRQVQESCSLSASKKSPLEKERNRRQRIALAIRRDSLVASRDIDPNRCHPSKQHSRDHFVGLEVAVAC